MAQLLCSTKSVKPLVYYITEVLERRRQWLFILGMNIDWKRYCLCSVMSWSIANIPSQPLSRTKALVFPAATFSDLLLSERDSHAQGSTCIPWLWHLSMCAQFRTTLEGHPRSEIFRELVYDLYCDHIRVHFLWEPCFCHFLAGIDHLMGTPNELFACKSVSLFSWTNFTKMLSFFKKKN